MPAISKSAPAPDNSQRLDALVRKLLDGLPWSRARHMIETGKVQVDGQVVTDPGRMIRQGHCISVHENAPRPTTERRLNSEAIAYVDDQVVVVRKPPGISSVPFEEGERGTLVELVRAWLNRTAKQRGDRATGDLGIVHRIDKETSGLLVFTRTLAAKRHLTQQMRLHTVERQYLAIAHGQVPKTSYRSELVQDRGDGLRGSTHQRGVGQSAVTHVEPIETFESATLVRCILETGRTHQIRIHLSEAGHPLLGEKVYIRDFEGPEIRAPRVMLHAEVLGFEHPTQQRVVRFEEPMPEDMVKVLERLRRGR